MASVEEGLDDDSDSDDENRWWVESYAERDGASSMTMPRAQGLTTRGTTTPLCIPNHTFRIATQISYFFIGTKENGISTPPYPKVVPLYVQLVFLCLVARRTWSDNT